MKEDLINIIKHAGKEVLKFHKYPGVNFKKDFSPITIADQKSHKIICSGLTQIKNVPILSEENEISFDVRKSWNEFWLVDPLDGTKEFINGFDDFCINIALIQWKKPILGLIYAPKLDEMYWAEKNKGFEYRGRPLSDIIKHDIVVAISRFHHSKETEKFMKINGLSSAYTMGSALKFGRMALGQIDLYPRFENSREWDIAAGQIILKESNCSILDLTTRSEPIYNKEDIKNNYFIASGPRVKKINFIMEV